MSGMTCAAFATDAGAKTLVVEKQERIGGSSNYSAGMLYVPLFLLIPQLNNVNSWGPQTFDKLRSWIPRGDPVLQKAWLKHYRPAVQWMRENGMSTGQRFDGIMTISA